MALPSQTERSSSSARVSASRTGGVNKAAITAAALLLAVGGIAGAVWFFGRTPTTTSGDGSNPKSSTASEKPKPVTPDDANKPQPRVGTLTPPPSGTPTP
ncbi:MAG TPA: hypothetical protein VK176_14130, partial [Phycisphaerales bacterium]|nr:hypothetical protein [Phycisphaerales bacterium]